MCSRPFAAALVGVALALLAGCAAAEAPPPAEELLTRPWDEILEEARGQRVTWGMWMGDPFINRYVEDFVRPRLRERYGVELELVSAQGRDIVAMLMTELEAGARESQIDLMWINGENFHQLRQIGALLAPITDAIPGAALVDMDDPFIRYDFQQDIEGFECPWGTVQFALIYDESRVPDPPRTPEALLAWARAHPGRFTIENGFTGMTFLKSLLIHFAGGPGSLDGPFDEARYENAAQKLWAYLRELRPHLWRRGETFPEELSQVHQLFAAGELDFTMSNNDGEVDNKVMQGLFPPSARAYVLETGTIRNSHYLGVSSRSPRAAGALVVIDFLVSPEAQYEKLRPSVWGDGTVLDVERLQEPWRTRFASLPGRQRAPGREEIRSHALREPAPETMIRLFEDFREEIIER